MSQNPLQSILETISSFDPFEVNIKEIKLFMRQAREICKNHFKKFYQKQKKGKSYSSKKEVEILEEGKNKWKELYSNLSSEIAESVDNSEFNDGICEIFNTLIQQLKNTYYLNTLFYKPSEKRIKQLKNLKTKIEKGEPLVITIFDDHPKFAELYRMWIFESFSARPQYMKQEKSLQFIYAAHPDLTFHAIRNKCLKPDILILDGEMKKDYKKAHKKFLQDNKFYNREEFHFDNPPPEQIFCGDPSKQKPESLKKRFAAYAKKEECRTFLRGIHETGEQFAYLLLEEMPGSGMLIVLRGVGYEKFQIGIPGIIAEDFGDDIYAQMMRGLCRDF